MTYECPTCDREFDSKNGRGVHHVKAHGESITHVERTCQRCGGTFERHRTYARKGHDKYCSRDCANKANGTGRTYVDLVCDRCGVDFQCELGQQDGKRFCSEECSVKWRSGENHPHWKGGVSHVSRGSNWNQQRRKALERDAYKCQVCSKGTDELGQNPDVHHIVPARCFTNRNAANVLGNLITLCRTHHIQAEHGSLTEPTPQSPLQPQIHD